MRVLAILLIPLFVGLAIGFEQRGPRPEQLMVENRSHHLALAAFSLYGFHVEHRPAILWNYDDDWPHGAWTDCKANTITVSWNAARDHLDNVLQEIMPHEYGHVIHCFKHGQVGREPHGPQWAIYFQAMTGFAINQENRQ